MSAPEVAFRKVAPRDVPTALAARAFDTAAHTQHYVGTVDGQDVVLLTLDSLPSEFLITDINVLPSERRRGFGASALAFAEGVARAEGRTEMKLRPHPLDAETSPGVLVAWYERAGFVVAGEPEGFFWTKRMPEGRGR